jgi:hypothetical protein
MTGQCVFRPLSQFEAGEGSGARNPTTGLRRSGLRSRLASRVRRDRPVQRIMRCPVFCYNVSPIQCRIGFAAARIGLDRTAFFTAPNEIFCNSRDSSIKMLDCRTP